MDGGRDGQSLSNGTRIKVADHQRRNAHQFRSRPLHDDRTQFFTVRYNYINK